MNHVRALIVLTGVCSTLLLYSSAFAWGDVGHSVICQIAYEELKPAIKARIDALIAIDPKFELSPTPAARQITRTSARLSITWTCRASLSRQS